MEQEKIGKFIAEKRMVLCFISLIVLIVALKFQNVEIYIIGTIAGMLSILFYRLGTAFNTSKIFKIGLAVLPIIFYPILALGNKQYKLNDEEYFKALDNAKGESINLMTQEEIKAENSAPIEEKPQVDSIFKSNIEMMEEVAPYKAAKIDILGMEKLKQATPQEDMFKPIEQVSPPEQIKEEEEEEKKQPSKFTSELDKKDDIEYIEL